MQAEIPAVYRSADGTDQNDKLLIAAGQDEEAVHLMKLQRLGEMQMEKENMFRKESYNRISSPDDVKDYIHVIRPPVWILLVTVLLLTAAGIIWAFTATVNVNITSEGKNIVESVKPISFLLP